jgi:hypothetical protein
MTPSRRTWCGAVLTVAMLLMAAVIPAHGLVPGEIVEVVFPLLTVSPSLYSMVMETSEPPALTYRLPDNYDPTQRYPLLVYVPGFHGGANGNIGNAEMIAGHGDWVVASLPLFKGTLDRDEVSGGIRIGFSDYPTLSKAYGTMLGRLFELVPNIDTERSAMVGFSNGALAIAVLVSNHDPFVLSHFKSFCFVDQGMFHLTDLHKRHARGGRYLVLSGDDRTDPGRDLMIRGGRLLEDSWSMFGVDLSFYVMPNTGHEFQKRQMTLVGRWLRGEPFKEMLPKDP